MTAAEKKIARADKVGRKIGENRKYKDFVLVWMGEYRLTVENFVAVKDGIELKITVYCDDAGNIKWLEESPRWGGTRKWN